MRIVKTAVLAVLLLCLFVILGLRFTENTEEPETKTAARQTMQAQVAVKLENTDAATVTAPQETEEPEDSQVNEIDWTEAADYIARTVYGEAGICRTTEQAAVIWCILNRVDSMDGYYPDDIISVIIQPGQFHGYDVTHPVLPELQALALDVIGRWQREKTGEADVGRVLPAKYLFFTGDGTQNYFRTDWRGGTVWDWSLPSPYED